MGREGPRWIAANFTEGVQKFDDAKLNEDVIIRDCENSGYLVPSKVKSVIIGS